MVSRGRPRRRKLLTVVFDTNALFNADYDALVCRAALNIIERHSNHGDLGIRWVIPEIVRGEREFQMRDSFKNVSQHVIKAEQLFGQQWGVTPDAVERRIAARIDENLAASRIDVVSCEANRVDWNDIMRRACFREPPFERGRTEKGFRDAIVCETFIQLASDLVGGDTAVLVSNDKLIRQHIESRGVTGHRARVVEDLNALNDEIQLRVANVDADTQANIERLAQLRFLPWENIEDPNCLWLRERVSERIWNEHGERLRQVPAGTSHVIVKQNLTNARLVSKDGNRVHFESTLLIRSGFRVWEPAMQDPLAVTDRASESLGYYLPGSNESPRVNSLWALLSRSQKMPTGEGVKLLSGGAWKEVENPAADEVSIRWSATFSRRRTLTRAAVDSIDLNVHDANILAFKHGVGSVTGA
ncbi:PIN domain-containing protein [Burkholderia gladioli]|uniref:PIN domain-containing protein n=1 Tax=Burkholderia gladioli TaxID=28095 RepID=UPI001641BC4F|nr:PIN domain-containing protein [Burkholderia gladioli]